MVEESHNVKWLDYNKNMLQVQRAIYLSSSMYDVVIASGESRFRAHQLILSASSEFFVEIFKEFPTNLTPTVIIPDLNPNLLECLLIFVYTGEVYIQSSCLPAFLELCSFLRVKGFVSCNCFINGVRLEQKICNFTDSNSTTTTTTTAAKIFPTISNEAQLSDAQVIIEESPVVFVEQIIESEPFNQDSKYCIAASSSQNIDHNQDQLDNQTSIEYSSETHFLEDPLTSAKKEESFDHPDNGMECTNLSVEDTSNYIDLHGTEEEEEEQEQEEEQEPDEEKEDEGDKLHSDDKIYAALEELNAGKLINEISEKHNIPKLTLYRKLRHNTDFRSLYRTVRHSVIEDAVQAVTMDGLSLQQASTQFCVSKTVLWRNLKKNKLYKPEEKMHAHRHDAIAALERGESLTFISKKYNIPLSTLHRDKVRLYDQGKLPKNCKIRKRDSGPDFQNRLKAAITCCEMGVSQKVASEMHNIPKTTIWRYLQHTKVNEFKTDDGAG